MKIPQKNEHVTWRWAAGVAEGIVMEVIPQRAEIVSKGRHVVRNGTKDNPAVIIRHKSGNEVIKLVSELFDISSTE